MKKIYLLGIGGIAMANLACLLKEQGYSVSGSDVDTFGPSAVLLKKHRINYFKNHDPGNIKRFKPDMVVIGNAMSRGNPSLEYIFNNQIPYCSMPEIIREEIIKNKKSIVIAGTSGKTTTTALTAWIFQKSGLKPTTLVGGIMKNTDSGFLSGSGKYVVIEGDEYNSSFYDLCPKFLHYRPYQAVITNIQPDHLDIYGNIENIIKAFQKLVRIVPSEGSLILNKENRYTRQLKGESRAKVTTFGKKGDIEAKNINYSPEGISFDLFRQNKKLGKINSPLLGNHNVENMLTAIAVALNAKIPFSKISSALATFQGVKRRLEIIYPVRSLARTKGASQNDLGEATSNGMNQKNGITVIDDFAHNPDKVSASLSALKKHFPKHKIIAIFEPRTGSSRRKFFQDSYPDSFMLADTVYIAESFKKESLKADDVFSNEKLVKDLNKKGITAHALKNADSIIAHIKKNLTLKTNTLTPKVFCVMTSGEFDGIHQKLVKLFN